MPRIGDVERGHLAREAAAAAPSSGMVGSAPCMLLRVLLLLLMVVMWTRYCLQTIVKANSKVLKKDCNRVPAAVARWPACRQLPAAPLHCQPKAGGRIAAVIMLT